MLYVTKNTLTAYTIAIVQNSQVLQYNQMHTALQTARNQASLETPLRVEELLMAHFNLAVLEDQKDADISPEAYDYYTRCRTVSFSARQTDVCQDT